MNGHFHKLKYVMIIIGIIIVYLLINRLDIVQEYISNPEALRTLVMNFGFFAPLAIILLQILQSFIPIFPSTIITIASGFIFGPWIGLILSLTGALLGSSAVFLVSRKFGKELALKLFGKKEIVHFHLLFRQKKNWGLFVARLMPLFPSDVISFGAGLTTISYLHFILVTFLGLLIQMSFFAHFGAKLLAGELSGSMIIISIVIILFILIMIFRKYVKELFIDGLKELREGEKWFKREEKFLKKEELFLEREFKKI